MTQVREVQWFLAKHVPDIDRNEPRNIGLVYRPADGPLTCRFLDRDHLPGWIKDREAYQQWTAKWLATIDKYGVKCLHWIAKRKPGETFYFEMAGAKLVSVEVDFDSLWKDLVE